MIMREDGEGDDDSVFTTLNTGNNPDPGSKDFGQMLCHHLRNNNNARDLTNDCRVRKVEAYSRNTFVYRIVCADRMLVAKVQKKRNGGALLNEFRVLQELQQRLPAMGNVRALSPVACFPEIGALITQEEIGKPVREFIDHGIGVCGNRRQAEMLMDHAAYGLHCFHKAYGIDAGSNGIEVARRYLDYSPRNVLVTEDDNGIVLMDPPEREEWGWVHLDIGTFCFDIMRAWFVPTALFRFPVRWLDQLKHRFIVAYFECLGRPVNVTDLIKIKLGEEQRAQYALRCYSRCFRYQSWPKELIRLMYFFPIITVYRNLLLKQSYNVKYLLNNGL